VIGSLYTQSTYSILRSTLHLEDIFKHAKTEGFDFVAITDDNNLHALYKTLVLSNKYQIKSIIGFQKTFEIEGYPVDLLIYAKDDVMLESLIELASMTSINPNISLSDAADLLKKLIVVVPTTQHFIHQNIQNIDVISFVTHSIKNNTKALYIGISNFTAFEKDVIVPTIMPLIKGIGIKPLPTYLSTYTSKDKYMTYDILNKIKDSNYKALDQPMHMLTKGQLLAQYKNYPEVFKNVFDLFGQVSYTYLDQMQELPTYPTKDNLDSKTYIKLLAHAGLKKRLENSGIKVNQTYMERINHELNVIDQMGYNDYFLIVYDFVRFAKTNDILVGPGRGSAAGSLVAYCLGITEVDPIPFDLLFERFLNIDRKSMPDIDLDFPDIKRDKVIDYVKNKYGQNHVVTMTTFTNLTTKTSMRDIARQMNLSQERINAIIASHTKGILDETDREAQSLIEVAQTIEGIPRQTGTHPAGIVLSKQNLTRQIPLMTGPKDILQSQLEASDLEALGYLKIDFLGLKNLTMIEDILTLEDHKFKLSDIPLDDVKTYETLALADVDGVFQLESQGMRSALRKLKPTQFEDIVAILALYRPGPMQFIDTYIERRHGADYPKIDRAMDAILKPTYGIIVYQEQIMKILQTYAGYALSEADIIRRAISKKDRSIIDKERKQFIERANKLGKDATIAETIYNHIEKFADYGFNKSHSVAYAYVAYYMAYLKTHYYQSFSSILMSQNTSNTGYLKTLIADASAKGNQVYPPDVNLSKTQFIPYKDGMLAPLTIVKGIGINVANKIIELQPFKSYSEFKEKMSSVINEKNIELLIHAGALDNFGLNHSSLLEQNNLSQTGFENFLDDYQRPKLEELSFNTLKTNEQAVLGFNLKYLKDQTLNDLFKTFKIQPMDLKAQSIITIGLIENVKIIRTKKGDEMAFITLNNGTILDLTLFPNPYKAHKDLLSESYIYIEATKDSNQTKENKYIINKIKKVKD